MGMNRLAPPASLLHHMKEDHRMTNASTGVQAIEEEPMIFPPAHLVGHATLCVAAAAFHVKPMRPSEGL